MEAVKPSRTQSGVMEMDELKKITKLITNHIVHRLDSIDGRLDLQEQVSVKVLENIQSLNMSHTELIKRLRMRKLIGVDA